MRRFLALHAVVAFTTLMVAAVPVNAALVLDPASIGVPEPDGFLELHFDPSASDGAKQTFNLPAADALPWPQARALKLHVQNVMPWPVTLMVSLQDASASAASADTTVPGSALSPASAPSLPTGLSTTVGIPPGPPFTLVVPLHATTPQAWGMRAAPPQPFDHQGETLLVATAVQGPAATQPVTLSLEVPTPDSRQTLRIGKVFLETVRDDERLLYAGVIDCLGQFSRKTWPGKRRCAEGLPQSAALMPRQQGASDIDFDRYGGIIVPSHDAGALATGFFRTWKSPAEPGQPARWWLLTPLGNRFFSLGVNAVQRDNAQTFVAGREFMFETLPLQDDTLAQFYGELDSTTVLPADAGAQRGRQFLRGRTYDFYRANLYRRDGAGFEQAWINRTASRLRDWQFNTVGAWSDADFTRAAALPYTAIIHVEGDYQRLSDGSNWWQGVADPFDPAFERAVRDSVAAGTTAHRGERQLIGYFIDNEPGFGDGGSPDPQRRHALALATLRMDGRLPTAHAKRAFVNALERRYGSLSALVRAWQLPRAAVARLDQGAGWQALLAPLTDVLTPDPSLAAVASDLQALQGLHAQRWFDVMATTVKAADPDHLYLGTRFASRTPEALAACAQWCDVVSFNLYVPDIANGFEADAFAAFDAPAMLTEFHFGSADRGPFWPGVMAVATEADRGPAYRRMLESVLANPQFVGAHWFQYLDQPASGRWLDGENGHLGLVDITDSPWDGFVDEVRQSNLRALRLLAR